MCILGKGLAYRRAISMAGRALASSQLDGCYGPFRMSASTWTRLFSFLKRSFGKKTVVQRLVFKMAFNEVDDTVSALPVGRCSRKRRIRPLLKQTLPL